MEPNKTLKAKYEGDLEKSKQTLAVMQQKLSEAQIGVVRVQGVILYIQQEIKNLTINQEGGMTK
tara:strand:- start:52 stop:243 length:192 start_codon:yes stop_codon:yes gene_type:complete